MQWCTHALRQESRSREQSDFAHQLAHVRKIYTTDETRRDGFLAVQQQLGDIHVTQREVAINLMLAYRDVNARDEMIA